MMLKNPRDGLHGQPPENAFLAVDERTGEQLGACVIASERKPVLYPTRPHQVRLDFEGGGDALDALIGAALARARTLCAEKSEPARIYARLSPDDSETLQRLKPYGFRDNDGVVRLRADLPPRIEPKQPAGCVVVRDRLEDAEEKKYFLERYNELFGTDYDGAWLREYGAKPGFVRILTVSPTGMEGEVVVWDAGGHGEIGFLQTARRWRHMGVAQYMLHQAMVEIGKMGHKIARADVRAKIPYILLAMEKAGFHQEKLIARYPGIDV